MAARRTKKTPARKSAVKKSAKKPAKKPAKKAAKPIELYYWPTPNGWKISIALEEMKLPYVMKPVNIGKGEQFEPAFLKISPNNRMPAIVDPDGPGGRPVSIFESGAILQYLGRKSGKLYPADERGKVQVEEWLFWQVGGLGPMAGQAHHFRAFASETVPYGIKRYTDEVNRLYGVLDRQLATHEFITGDYSIADMAAWPWIVPHERQGQKLSDFLNVKRWFEAVRARPAVQRAYELGHEKAADNEAYRYLYGQTAESLAQPPPEKS